MIKRQRGHIGTLAGRALDDVEGVLDVIEDALDIIERSTGERPEWPRCRSTTLTYEMLAHGDSVGVFQF